MFQQALFVDQHEFETICSMFELQDAEDSAQVFYSYCHCKSNERKSKKTHFQRKQIPLLPTKLCSYELSDMAGKILTKRKPHLFLEFYIKSQSIGFMKLTISRSLHPRLDKCYKWPFRETPATLWQSHQPENISPVFELTNIRLPPIPDLSLIITEPDTHKKILAIR